MKDNIKIIIPAAGYGTRVNSPLSKEMLNIDGTGPLINYALKIADENKADSIVITRSEKTNLVEHLTSFSSVKTLLCNQTLEWPETVLYSKDEWGDKNVLLLPDTRFSPVNIIPTLISDLDRYSLSIGAFDVSSNQNTWGGFDFTSPSYTLIEKPNTDFFNFKAWGIIAFKKEIGEELFTKILDSTFDHAWKKTNFNYISHDLNFFKDLTR